MKRKHNSLTEHYLVPAVLFLLNICLVQLIHAFLASAMHSPAYRIAVVAAFILLASSLLVKSQAHMAGSIVFYMLVALLL